MPQPPLPDGTPADQPVLLQVLADLDGKLHNATYVGGPTALAGAAIAAVGSWQAEPARINGAPIAAGSHLLVRFRKPQSADGLGR